MVAAGLVGRRAGRACGIAACRWQGVATGRLARLVRETQGTSYGPEQAEDEGGAGALYRAPRRPVTATARQAIRPAMTSAAQT